MDKINQVVVKKTTTEMVGEKGICYLYIVLFFYKKSIDAKIPQKFLSHNLCMNYFHRIFMGGFFYIYKK